MKKLQRILRVFASNVQHHTTSVKYKFCNDMLSYEPEIIVYKILTEFSASLQLSSVQIPIFYYDLLMVY
jgi:hypothetical protein